MLDERCEGCGISHRCKIIPQYTKWPKVERMCPCIDCLIKMMCKNGCDLYVKYSRYHPNLLRK